MQFVTGHQAAGGSLPQIDWAGVADPWTTTAIYMPKRTLAAITAAAIEHGIDPATPAVAVADATRASEILLRATIADLAARLEAVSTGAPVVVLIGRVLAHAAATSAAASESLLAEARAAHASTAAPRSAASER